MFTPDERIALVESIHQSPAQLVLAVTGGGHAIITDLLGVAGASATVLEAIVPYSAQSLHELVGPGHANHSAVSPEMAGAMAVASARRAGVLGPEGSHFLGVACTATIATNRAKRGEHRAHIAIAKTGGAMLVEESVTLERGAFTRVEEDRLVADHLLQQLAYSVK